VNEELRENDQRREAILRWNDLLASCSDPGAVCDTILGLQEERGLICEGKPFCGVARPRFVTAVEMGREQRAVTHLSTAVRKVRDAVLADERLRADHLPGFDAWLASIAALEPRAHAPRSILRFDSFTTPAGLRFVELNGDIPMGSVANDGLVAVFRKLGFYAEFEEQYDVRPDLVQLGMIQTFLHVWQGERGHGTPKMCVLSFPGGIEDVFTALNAGDLAKLGFEITAAHPEDLELRDGKLRAHGRAVDLVYRIMHLGDCLRRADEIAPLLQAVRQGAVCLVNPFRSAVLSHKYLFALLTDGRHDFGFTRNEQAAIRAHVPWGRVLQDGPSSDPQGRSIDLLEFVSSHRDDLVLKPAHEAGGAGVHLGWRCDQAAWDGVVAEAAGAQWVVQERIEVAREEYPLLEAGFPLRDFFEDTDPFHFPGGYSAVMTRISSAEITNVALGGSIVPTFVIDAR
jgi:hypothetical protein